MALITEQDRKHLLEEFQKLKDKVRLVFFTQEFECETCKLTRQLLEEVSALSAKLELVVYDFQKDKEMVKKYEIDKIPAIVLEGATSPSLRSHGIRYFGTPAGYEFSSLIEDIIDVSRRSTDLSAETKQAIAAINRLVHMQVFVTPTCPYCPGAVRLAHKLAMENDLIKGDMVMANEFPHLAVKYNVFAVPKVIINEKIEFEGALPERAFVEQVLKAIS